MPQPRVTLKTLAARLGVSHMTVSLALRGHRSISEKTRLKVKALARELGYRPDPMLSALVAYRRGLTSHAFQGVLGWLTNYPTANGWAVGQQVGYHAGARRRAKELGYELAEFWMNDPGLTKTRLRQIMIARNVQGLIVAAQPRPRVRLDFNWTGFAAVSLGYSLMEPKLHLVMNHQFRNMVALIQELLRRGYQRIGLAMPLARDERVEHNYLAGYLMGMHSTPAGWSLPPHLPDSLDWPAFLRWCALHQPGVIVTETGSAKLLAGWLRGPELRKLGIELALTNIPYGEKRYSGIDEHPEMVGATAVEVVVGMIHRNEFGVPENARHILIQGSWWEGQTLRRVSQRRAARTTRP